jgi:hypothetical protein
MSTGYKEQSHYENHRPAEELEKLSEHAHLTGEKQGKQEHLSGTEQSRLAHEHFEHGHAERQEPTVGHGIIAFGHKEIEALAHALWLKRGSPQGSPEVDWHEAVKELRLRHADQSTSGRSAS